MLKKYTGCLCYMMAKGWVISSDKNLTYVKVIDNQQKLCEKLRTTKTIKYSLIVNSNYTVEAILEIHDFEKFYDKLINS